MGYDYFTVAEDFEVKAEVIKVYFTRNNQFQGVEVRDMEFTGVECGSGKFMH